MTSERRGAPGGGEISLDRTSGGSSSKRDGACRPDVVTTGRPLSQLAGLLAEDLALEIPVLEAALAGGQARAAARPLIALLLLQRWSGLGDEDLRAEVADRLSLRRFCGLSWSDPLPSPDLLAHARQRVDDDANACDVFGGLVEKGLDLLRGPQPLLSIVSPVYRAEEAVPELVRRIRREVAPLTEQFEIVLVDDGSPDRSWERIQECCRDEPRVVGIKLSRNFGQHAAITAGLAHARGEWMVVMDCDLQDNPRYIPQLYREGLRGYDIVYTVKERREHARLKNWSAGLFVRISNWLSSGDRADPRIGAYSLVSRRVVDAFLKLPDAHRHYLVLLRWLGFPSTAIPIRHEPRLVGRSSYSFRVLIRHSIDGIVSHSDKLLYLSVAIGFAFLSLSLLGAFGLALAYFVLGFREGWTSTIVLILLTTSIILLSIGTAGIYIGKIFEQVKQRPLYLVDQIESSSGRSPRRARRR